MLNRRGSVLIIAYSVLFVLLLFGGIFFSRTLADMKLFNINRERLESFYLAESAVGRGLVELASSYAYAGTGGVPWTLGRGEYELSVTSLSSDKRQLIGTGYVPSKADNRAERRIEVVVKKTTPPNFFDHAIYSANEVDFNGNSYVVNGDVIYANTIDNPGNVNGNVTKDPSIAPLALFDFADLRGLAVSQGNLYDSDRLKEIGKNKETYPSPAGCSNCSVSRGCTAVGGGAGMPECEFWWEYPSNPTDPTTGTPNVVYVEGDMVLNGNIGQPGGFFLVVGNVLTDPNDTSDASINGNGTVNGCIYTLGKFSVNGGGGNLNVNGGVWTGSEAELNGNANVTYDLEFMTAIKGLVEGRGSTDIVQILSWRELV
ncbi:MAG: hypothetical protein V1863_03165 [Candidatus Omnitrophota bacterium]